MNANGKLKRKTDRKPAASPKYYHPTIQMMLGREAVSVTIMWRIKACLLRPSWPEPRHNVVVEQTSANPNDLCHVRASEQLEG